MWQARLRQGLLRQSLLRGESGDTYPILRCCPQHGPVLRAGREIRYVSPDPGLWTLDPFSRFLEHPVQRRAIEVAAAEEDGLDVAGVADVFERIRAETDQ
jgi:hypothetical protein